VPDGHGVMGRGGWRNAKQQRRQTWRLRLLGFPVLVGIGHLEVVSTGLKAMEARKLWKMRRSQRDQKFPRGEHAFEFADLLVHRASASTTICLQCTFSASTHLWNTRVTPRGVPYTPSPTASSTRVRLWAISSLYPRIDNAASQASPSQIVQGLLRCRSSNSGFL
jgi:hypothetical protein